jgi:hypothetical protein
LGCNTVWSGRNFLTFQRNQLSPFIGYTNEDEAICYSETLVNFYQAAQHHIPDML